MAYADQEVSSNRIIAIVVVGLIHVLIGWALISGLAISTVKDVVKTVTTVNIEEPEPEPEPEEPPPPPPDAPPPEAPPPPVAPPVKLNISPPREQVRTTTKITPPTETILKIPAAKPAPKPAPEPAPPSQARGATPDNPGRWGARIQENYPSRAIRREIEGNVTVRVGIDARGRVSSCTVTNSSGSDILDEAACDGMSRYARYNPALDDAGNPTSGSDTQTIVYRLS